MPKVSGVEEEFYARYDWCLNPTLSIRQLLHSFNQELNACRASEGWQREECRINLYLFACAIACTTDGYFGQRLLNLSVLRSRLPRLGSLLTATECFLNSLASLLKIFAHWRAWRWRKRWNSTLHELCDLLISGGDLRVTSSMLPHVPLPETLLSRKMRLPGAFRGQDFTHHDVLTLIQRFCASSGPSDEPVTIVGLRTAGAYFAPLMAAYLKHSNWPQVSWLSIRPTNGTSTWEKWQLRNLRRP